MPNSIHKLRTRRTGTAVPVPRVVLLVQLFINGRGEDHVDDVAVAQAARQLGPHAAGSFCATIRRAHPDIGVFGPWRVLLCTIDSVVRREEEYGGRRG